MESTTEPREDIAAIMHALGHRDLTVHEDIEYVGYATVHCGRCSATVYKPVEPRAGDRTIAETDIQPRFAARPVPTCDEVLANDREMGRIIADDAREAHHNA